MFTFVNKAQFLLQQEIVAKVPSRVRPLLPLSPDILLKLVESFIVGLQEELPELVQQRLPRLGCPGVGLGRVDESETSVRRLATQVLLQFVQNGCSGKEFVTLPIIRSLLQVKNSYGSGCMET